MSSSLTHETDLALRRLALPFVLFPGLLVLPLAGCKANYSANTYAANAAQEEAAVQRGTIVGVRQVMISADGTIGAATGGAVGGVAGSQVAGAPLVTALGAIGGGLVGGIGGAAAAHVVADTKGWEYIVDEEPGDKLVSVTQTSKMPLPIGLHVLVIADAQQARIVPDYTVQLAAAPPAVKPAVTKPAAPAGSTTLEIDISPALPAAVAPLQGAPLTMASDPASPPAPNPAPAGAVAAPAVPASSSSGAATAGPVNSPAGAASAATP